MNHHRLRRGFNALATSFSSKTRHNHKIGARQRPYKSGPISTSWTDLCDTDTDEEPITSRSIMGGKSNKFDYTNRANSGAALGHIIARDLEKEATKAARGAERRDSRARKRSGSGIGGQDEECHGGHVLDLKVPGKDLGDEGVIAMAEGLVSVLSEESVAAKIALEDLVLSENAITTASLARLAPVIVLARYSLKTLNLANNKIKVETDQEAAEWEQFLRAFGGCYKLRRLDLSGNPELGAKAMEIFARVHMPERHITPMPAGGETSVVSLAEEMGDKAEVDTTTEMTADGDFTNNLMARGTVLKRRCGLRSIPYITLNNVGLTDRGAMFLSYVLEEHYYPNQLIENLNAALPGSNITAYQQDTNFSGIDWDEREAALGRDGLHLLKKTELFRRQTMLEDDHGTLASMELTAHTSHGIENHPPNGSIRGSIDRRHSRALPGDRRTSIRSIRTADGGEHELSDLESARRRLQRSIIAADGAYIVDLWRTGLRLVTSSRVLGGIGPLSRNLQRLYYSGSPRFDFSADGKEKIDAARPVTPSPPVIEVTPSFDSGLSSPFTQTRKPSCTSTTSSTFGLAPDVPEQPLTDVTNTPETPKRNFKPHRKGAFSDGSDLHAVTQKLDSLLVHSHNPQRFVRWQEERIAADPDAKRAFRDTRVPSHLPASLRDAITEFSVIEKKAALLSEKQRRDAIEWGRNRRNFETEKEWRKMADSAQVWTLLESIGCLDYHRGE